jgi:HD-GYP domain-containing protein (c-di-GMP phosphodiesterase class II)
MTTDRSYRKALSKDEAVAELRRSSGTQLHPDVVEAFVAVAEPSYAFARDP